MHHAPVPALIGSASRSPGLLGLLGKPPRQLGEVLEPPLPVVFDVNHHPPRNRILSADNAIHDVLEGVESLARRPMRRPPLSPLTRAERSRGPARVRFDDA